MTLYNKTRKTILSRDIREARGFYDSAKGLIGSPKPRSVMFKTRLGIHTFFMKYAIDVIVTDKNLVVQKLRLSLRPFRLYFWNPIYPYVIELPKGTIGRSGTLRGDILDLSPQRQI